jgi:hypothetical protein
MEIPTDQKLDKLHVVLGHGQVEDGAALGVLGVDDLRHDGEDALRGLVRGIGRCPVEGRLALAVGHLERCLRLAESLDVLAAVVERGPVHGRHVLIVDIVDRDRVEHLGQLLQALGALVAGGQVQWRPPVLVADPRLRAAAK